MARIYINITEKKKQLTIDGELGLLGKLFSTLNMSKESCLMSRVAMQPNLVCKSDVAPHPAEQIEQNDEENNSPMTRVL